MPSDLNQRHSSPAAAAALTPASQVHELIPRIWKQRFAQHPLRSDLHHPASQNNHTAGYRLRTPGVRLSTQLIFMNTPPILPEHEVVVSSVTGTEASVIFRVVEDYHPETKPNAYEISIIGPRDQSAIESFLHRCHRTAEGIYVVIENGNPSIQTYDGDEIEFNAQSFSLKQDALNVAELNAVLERVWKWCEMEHKSNTTARRRINEARKILSESARRIEKKAASHSAGSTAGTLYSQQLSLIQRLRHALED